MKFIFCLLLKCLFLPTTKLIIANIYWDWENSCLLEAYFEKNDSRHDIFCVLYFLIEKKIHAYTAVSIQYY